eukprot:COSAG02_NODE_6420_length_3584_cov_12.288666_2_plen_134_part_00
MDITNVLFAVLFIMTRIFIYGMGLVQLIWDLFFSAPAADHEKHGLELLPQCKTRLIRQEQEHNLEHVQSETGEEHDVSLIGCERTQQMIYVVVTLLVIGQVLNVIWASQIVRMARTTKGKGRRAKAEYEDKSH